MELFHCENGHCGIMVDGAPSAKVSLPRWFGNREGGNISSGSWCWPFMYISVGVTKSTKQCDWYFVDSIVVWNCALSVSKPTNVNRGNPSPCWLMLGRV